jgi:lantibiotic modifying enzyme
MSRCFPECPLFEESKGAVLRALEDSIESGEGLGYSAGIMNGFGGVGSLLYAFNLLLQEPGFDYLRPKSNLIIDSIRTAVVEDQVFDIVGGTAGTLCNLLDHYCVTGNQQPLDVAIMCGEHLLSSAKQQERGIAWNTLENSRPLCGFAHGVSGIAYSLFRLAHVTGNHIYAEAAIRGIEYERSCFSEPNQNWPDLRDWSANKDSVVWCYGAPGVGLCRLAQLNWGFADAQTETELKVAFEKTITSPWGTHCLCHGGFGNLEFLALASERTQGLFDRQRVRTFLDNLLHDIAERGLLYEGYSETLNLMLGLAGVAHALIRYAFPETVGSPLLLESQPPMRAGLPCSS